MSDSVEEANQQPRFTISPEHIAKYAGWFNYSTLVDAKGFTKMHAAIKEDRQLAVCGYVCARAGWLDPSFFKWITNE